MEGRRKGSWAKKAAVRLLGPSRLDEDHLPHSGPNCGLTARGQRWDGQPLRSTALGVSERAPKE